MKYLESEQKTRAKLEEICTENESKLVEMQGELELMELDRDDHRERFTKIEGDLASAMKEILVSRGDVVEKLSETNQQKKQVESLKTQVSEEYVCLSVCLSACLSVCLSVCLFVCLSIYLLLNCLPTCISVACVFINHKYLYLSVCIIITLSFR